MFKMLKKASKVGEATVLYPFAPLEVAPGFRGKPEYNFDRCIACGACAIACPPNAITMECHLDTGVKSWQIFYGRCIFCGRCEEVCPPGAITLSPDFELAAGNKEDLYIKADFKLVKCSQCEDFFTPARQIEYNLVSLKLAGLPEAALALRRQQMEVCPACKRRLEAGKAVKMLSKGTHKEGSEVNDNHCK